MTDHSRLDIHVFAEQVPQLDEILRQLRLLHEGMIKIMATLADVQAAVTAENTVIDSAVALIQGLAAQVAALAPNQAAIDALAADIKAKSDSLAAAVAANTPAA
jgi:ABC-type transporter Mla subunit MlaD